MHLKKSLLFGCYLFFAMCLSSIAFAKTQKEYQENHEMCVKANSSLVDAPYECALATTGASEQNVVHVFEALQERFKQSAPSFRCIDGNACALDRLQQTVLQIAV